MYKMMKRSITVVLAICLVLSCLVFSVSVSAAGGALAVSVESKEVTAGATVEVAVSITTNPGVSSVRLCVEYDTDILTLTGAADTQLLKDGVLGDTYQSPYKMVWIDGTSAANNTATGAIAKLTFKVSDTAVVGDTADVKVYLESANDIVDVDDNTLTLSATNGVLTVAEKRVIMPATSAEDIMASIRFEDKDASPYVSAGLRFRGSLTDAMLADADEIGFVVAPSNAILNDANWYKHDAQGNLVTAIAKSAVCYDKAGGKNVIYDDSVAGKTAYQVIITNLSAQDGRTSYDLELSAVMYVKTGSGYTYYAITSATFNEIKELYIQQGIPVN